MDRQTQILSLQNYIKEVDKDITMILQNLQWDRSVFQKEEQTLLTCKYDPNHKMPSNKLTKHEETCFLKCNGYSSEDVLLPELLDINAKTVVKCSTTTIKDIFQKAAEKDPLFKRGDNNEAVTPLSLERLHTTYTADERRAIHDAVVGTVQAYQQEEEFVLPSGSKGSAQEHKSWLERLAEQRDRRRRRTKYRAPPKTKNYSLVLRDVIAAQMEFFNELHSNYETDSHRERHSEDIEHSSEKRPKETKDRDYDKNIAHANEAIETNSKRHHRERHNEDFDHTREKPRDQSYKHNRITYIIEARDTQNQGKNRQQRERNSEDIDREDTWGHSYKDKHRSHVNDTRDTQTREAHRSRQHRERHDDHSRRETSDQRRYKNKININDAEDTYTHTERYQIGRNREFGRNSRQYRNEEDEQSKERERSRRDDYDAREKKHGEYRSDKRDRDKQNYASDRKSEKYEKSYEKSDRDRSYSKKREDYKHKKDYKY